MNYIKKLIDFNILFGILMFLLYKYFYSLFDKNKSFFTYIISKKLTNKKADISAFLR